MELFAAGAKKKTNFYRPVSELMIKSVQHEIKQSAMFGPEFVKGDYN